MSRKSDFIRPAPLKPYGNKGHSDEQRESYRQARRWRAKLKYRYGITPEQFYAMLKKQNYRCAICTNKLYKDSTHVDHEGDGKEPTSGRKWNGGKFRGLLCESCNMRLGFFEIYREGILTYLGLEVV